MKNYAKLLVIAFVLAIFSVGAVAASENVTADTGDLTQVPHEQVVSVADPTVQEIETTTTETSGDDAYVNEVSSSSDDIINVTDSNKESLKESKKEYSLLGASNDEEVLSATRYLSSNTFAALQNAIDNAQTGDIIDLRGQTISGYRSLTCDKDITIANGALNGNDYLAAYTFQRCKLENLSLYNFHMNWGASINYCTLNNVAFYNFLTNQGCTLAIRYCNLESVNFTNCHSLMPADPTGEDFETGVMIVTYGSTYNNCYFTNCSTNRHSGAICVAGSQGNTANITNCVFTNCSSGVGGAIYLHGTGLSENRHSNIINCTFIDCKATEYGGAIGSSQDYLNIENCEFYNNTAKRGGAIMVGGITHGLDGDNSEGHNNLLNNCSFFNNIASEEGGAVHITGDNNEALNCTFDDNFAHGGNGSAIYVHGLNASVYDSNFTNHDCARGTVYIYGENSTIQGSIFENNTASKGGAGVYILGNNTILDDNVFNGNNATIHGGAIHTHGNNAIISNSVFTNNNAIPNITDKSQGLGGAIYIHGDNNLIYNSNFTGNTARNGSAIYNNGDNLTIEECNFLNNQAWSYIIITITEPPSPMYYNETQKVKVNLTMVGGDNIINAIHNAEDPNQIYLYNVTYYHSTTNTTRTTTKDEIHPRDGVENSEGGKYLYQDDREDLQVINVVVTRDSDNKVILNTTGEDLRTGLYGNLTVTLNPILIDGNYTIFAEHPADENYTAISNTTSFEIIPYVDVSVTKTSNKDVYIVGENAIFTIVVRNVGSEATNVTVRDILPGSLKFVSAVATQGTYDSSTNIWSVGNMTNGSSKTLTLTVTTTELGSFDNVVNVTSNEKDWNLSNNVANKTIEVNLYYDKEVNVTNTSAGEYIEYYLNIYNIGDSLYNDTIQVRDTLPNGIKYTGEYQIDGADLVRYINYVDIQIWYITNISANSNARITIKAQALQDGVWNNTMNVWDYPEKNATVNVTSDADLEVIKDVSSPTANNGDIVNWTIIVINNGPSKAYGVYVDDIIPGGLVIVNEPYPETGTSYNKNTGVWTIGDLDVGERKTLIISTRITVSNENITNEATVNSTTPDSNPDNNYDNATVEVTPEGDVGVEKVVSNNNVNHSSIIYWTITVTNYGPDTATGVFVTDVLPAGLQFINSTITKGRTYNPVSGNWYIGDLAKGENATLIVYTRVTEHNTLINNVAIVNSTSIDTNPNNNKDEDFINVGPEADLQLTKEANVTEASKGDYVTWTITVKNNGPNDAEDVYVSDILPDGLKFVSSSSRRYNNNTGIWNIGHLSNGSTATLTILTIVTTSNDIVENYAVVNSSTYDPDPYNNDDDDDVVVKTEADVGIIKLVSNQTSHYGDEITWTLVVTNYGPDAAENVYVIDFLPANLRQTAQPYITKGHISHLGTNGLWIIGTLENGETATMIIYTKVMESNVTIINVANVTSTNDPDLSNNWAENGTYVPPECDVEVIKRVSNSTPNKYDEVTWTITVINHGRDIAENVVVTDVLPDGLQFVSNTAPTIGSYSKDRNEWTIGDLAVNVRQNLTITTTVVDTGEITNEVNVTTSTYDTDETNNYDNETIDVPAIADLEITKLVSNKTPKYYDLINWTITVHNNGPNNARNVVVTDKLPAGLIYISHNLTTGLYDPSQGIWQIGDVLHYENETLTITTRVNITNATITNIAVVTSTTPDPNPDNNEANNTTTVGPIADLAIDKTVNDYGPAKGDNITWTITVVNNGPDAAINAYVEDVIPAGLIFINATSEHGAYDNNTNIWTIGDIANGDTRVLYIVTLVNVTKEVITNTANVTSDTEDSDLTNNEDNSTIDVGHQADLKIIKTVSNSTPSKGDVITWNITVINLGPDTAIEAYVVDVLPDGLVYQSDDSNGKYNPATGIWIIGDLAKDANATLLIETLVNVSGKNITNIAVVDSDTDDPNPENNEDNDTIDVENIADLRVLKYVNPDVVISGETVYWTVYVENIGPDTAINAYAIDILPKNLIFVAAKTYYGKYNSTTGRYTYSDGTGDEYNSTNGVWTIGNMSTGDFGRLTLETIANSTVETTIINEVTVNSSTPESDYDNNYDYNMVDVVVLADLEITKEVSNKTPHAGDKINWTITVTNNGPSDAFDVNVTDKLPDGLVYQTDDSNGKYNATTGVWEIGNLTVGETKVLVITTLVNITNATITNVANVNSTTPDPDETNNKDNNTTKVDPEADLEIIKLVSSSTAKKGDLITWTILVTNKGPDTALNVFVRDELPTGLVLTKYSKTKGLFDSDSFTWFISKLEKGESQTLTLITLVNVTNKTLVNNVNVTNDVYDPNETNNEANNTTDVEPLADLVVVKEVSNKNPKYGETITWTVTVTNKGPDVAVNTKVTDKLPTGLVFVTSDGDYDAATGIWTVGDLAKGESKSLVITTLVNITNTTIRNVANATSDTPGNDTPGNNTTDVGPNADIVVVKFVSSNVTKTGDVITWTVVVTNNGPDVAVNTRVTDKLPADLIYNGHKADVGNYDPETGVWIVGDLANGESKQLVISTIVNITNKTIVNVANVTSDTPGNKTNGTNNTTSAPKADLVVVKEVSNKNPKFGERITWTVTVTNKGPDVAVNTKVTDKLPAGLVFVTSDGDYDAATGIWTVGDLAKGESKSLVITTLVNITNATIRNIANATSHTPGNDTPGNNTTDVGSIADLEVIKLVSNSTAKKGDIITWTIVVTNNGPDAAVNANVTDKLPAGLIYSTHKADKGIYDPSNGIWIIGDMAKGDVYKLVITTIVDISNGTIENIAVGNSSTPDNNTDNNKGNNTTTVNDDADLEIVKVVSNKNPHKGETITWTITVTNNGPSDAKNVKVTDKLPDGLVFAGSNGAYNPVTGEWTVGDLANGKSASLIITTIVNITNKNITNVANVTSDTPDSNKTNNEANNTTEVSPEADLVIIKTVSNSTPAKGDVITWTITVTNNGPDDAVNVTIFDEIPEGLLVIENGKVLTTRNITVFIPEIQAYQTTTFDFETLVNITNRNITNVAVVNSTTYDPNETNNEDNETVDVPAEADLGVVKLVSNATVHKGNVVIWTVIVTNHGPDVADNVYVTDILPAELIYKAHTTTKGLFDSNSLTWFITSLANGESQTLTLSTEVNATNKTITNIVNVTSDTPDSNKSNNVANNTTDVPPEADIGVVKEVNATECMKDQFVEWTITMTNHGPDGANNVIVKDNLPDSLIFVSSDGNYDPETGIWTIDYLANGETRVLHIITKVNTTGMIIVNNVTVTSGVYDPDMSNNKANNSTVVKSIADLEISKVVSDSNPHKGDVITWTITVTNNGPDTAEDVTVTDKLPDGLVFVDADGNYDDETGIWTVGDLANGKTATLVITTLVDFTNANVTNVAVVNSSTPDNNTDNNKDNDTTGVDPEADICVIKTVSNPKPSKGDIITWTIVVTNFGPDVAENVYVEEFLPEGLRLLSAKGSKGSYLNEIWTVGDLNNGEIATLTLTTRVVASSGTIENIVIAHTSTYDPNETNNKDKEETKVKKASASADLELTKVANKDKVKVGDLIIWTITVINHGPDKASGVYVQDILDAGDVEFVSADADVGAFDEDTGIWDIGDMEDGETVTLIVVFKALAEGEVVNYAEVVSETPDPNPDNNYDVSVVDVVKDVPDKHNPNTPKASTPTMHATGNPIVMVLLALLAIAGVSLRRKD